MRKFSAGEKGPKGWWGRLTAGGNPVLLPQLNSKSFLESISGCFISMFIFHSYMLCHIDPHLYVCCGIAPTKFQWPSLSEEKHRRRRLVKQLQSLMLNLGPRTTVAIHLSSIFSLDNPTISYQAYCPQWLTC